jgi:hypothetical protein
MDIGLVVHGFIPQNIPAINIGLILGLDYPKTFLPMNIVLDFPKC